MTSISTVGRRFNFIIGCPLDLNRTAVATDTTGTTTVLSFSLTRVHNDGVNVSSSFSYRNDVSKEFFSVSKCFSLKIKDRARFEVNQKMVLKSTNGNLSESNQTRLKLSGT